MAQKIGRGHQGITPSPDRWIGCLRSLQLKIVLLRSNVERLKEILRSVGRLDET